MENISSKDLILLSNYFYWQNRESYLELMKLFLKGKIGGKQFDSEFSKMRSINCNQSREWKKVPFEILKKEFPEFPVKIDAVELSKMEDFSTLINELFTDCDVFEPDPDLRDYFEISEEELKNCVEKALLKMQKYL